VCRLRPTKLIWSFGHRKRLPMDSVDGGTLAYSGI
jgi:hypothetical protein